MEQPNRVLTGVNDTKLVGQYLEWNNHTEMKGWGTRTARMINGTGGFLFHPGVTREENLTVFVDELYRLVSTHVSLLMCTVKLPNSGHFSSSRVVRC